MNRKLRMIGEFEALDRRIVPSGGGSKQDVAAAVQQTATSANFGNLISALNNITAQIGNLNALNNVNAVVSLVNVQDVLNGNNVTALNNALNNNLDNVHILQDFLNNSVNNNTVQIIKDALNNNNVAIGQVVGINVLSGGQVVVFTLPPPPAG